MIAHHQGAIDMVKTELADGMDPDVRQLAKGGIVSQGEVALMEAWLARQPN